MNTQRTRILVSPYILQNGQWSKRRILWASFRCSMDANIFLDQLRKQNPTWVIEVKS